MKTLTMSWKKMMITGVLAIGMVALLGGCGSQGGDQAQKANTLKVGTNATFVPFEFKKEGSEELQGFDIEVATEIAKFLKLKKKKQRIGKLNLKEILNLKMFHSMH